MDATPFRESTATEREILDRLLEARFEGREALRKQLGDCRVRRIDGNGSLEFLVHSHPNAPVRWRIPVEGEVEDNDGIVVHLLLHVVDGIAQELEIYKDDVTSKLVSEIDPSRLELFCPPLVR